MFRCRTAPIRQRRLEDPILRFSLFSRFTVLSRILTSCHLSRKRGSTSSSGDGRSAGHDTKNGGKERFWLRMATEGGYLQGHVYRSNLLLTPRFHQVQWLACWHIHFRSHLTSCCRDVSIGANIWRRRSRHFSTRRTTLNFLRASLSSRRLWRSSIRTD